MKPDLGEKIIIILIISIIGTAFLKFAIGYRQSTEIERSMFVKETEMREIQVNSDSIFYQVEDSGLSACFVLDNKFNKTSIFQIDCNSIPKEKLKPTLVLCTSWQKK